MKTCVIDKSHKVAGKLFVKKGVDIYLCQTCGCILADFDFNHAQYESETYYTMVKGSKESIDYEWGFRWRYILQQIMNFARPSNLLDVGAGNGYFVGLARDEYGLQADGLEISAQQIAFAKQVLGVDLINESVEEHKNTYDVITAFNVLEHVPDPKSFMSSLVDRIKPGGYLVVTTPNPGCIHVRVKGLNNWNMIDPPHHINLFTKDALNQLVTQNGLTEVHYGTLSTYINFVQKYDTRGLILRRIFFHSLRVLGLGADHFLIARKEQ